MKYPHESEWDLLDYDIVPSDRPLVRMLRRDAQQYDEPDIDPVHLERLVERILSATRSNLPKSESTAPVPAETVHRGQTSADDASPARIGRSRDQEMNLQEFYTALQSCLARWKHAEPDDRASLVELSRRLIEQGHENRCHWPSIRKALNMLADNVSRAERVRSLAKTN